MLAKTALMVGINKNKRWKHYSGNKIPMKVETDPHSCLKGLKHNQHVDHFIR